MKTLPYEIAKKELGVTEIPGEGNNPRIVEYHRTTKPESGRTDDEIPWCSSFVNFCVEKAGIVGIGSKWAKSWDNWGQDVTSNPKEGDIVVFSRGYDENGKDKGGHVGFFEGYVDDEKTVMSVLGGNQRCGGVEKVCYKEYTIKGTGKDFDKLCSIRRKW